MSATLVPSDHPALRRAATVVRPSQRTLAPLARRMRAAMTANDGVGLAAPQIGVGQRVFVVAWEGTRLAVANPTLTPVGDRTTTGTEGCLSLPGRWWDVTRPDTVELTGYDIDQDRHRRWILTGFVARIVGHELDHLDGVCIDTVGTPAVGDAGEAA